MNLQQEKILKAMLDSGFYPESTDHVEFIETHISLVFLTGQFAYKVKKSVNFGFLDFTELVKRKFYCEEELRLNGRLAPDIYLDVIPITESQNKITLNGNGTVIEYAIKMKQFDQHGLLSNLVTENTLTIHHIIELAEVIADFHQTINRISPEQPFGDSDEILKPVMHNFKLLKPIINDKQLQTLHTIESATQLLHQQLTNTFKDRKETGYIRECHGDLHLGNITLIDNKVTPFDGIEFNDSFRWIDTMSEIAFLIMDLEDHEKHIFASIFLNRYLETTGDYTGLKTLTYYKIYRAMVRAKVTGLRLQQISSSSEEYRKDTEILNNYLNLARQYCTTKPVSIIITHGISGSGKSWLANRLVTLLNGVIIHSDNERKRLYSGSVQNLYDQNITDSVYNHLLDLTGTIIQSGYTTLVDATFLNADYRKNFRKTAENLGVKFIILNCVASEELMKSRLLKRDREKSSVSDADTHIMHKQLSSYKPLNDDELELTLTVDTGTNIKLDEIAHLIITNNN
ncbi:MAG: AAA family ATPase [Gammaproteobacteria bacterium]|nr:AAA family ATPase [Gammaproteobacteria bacterium]MDH5734596.1 AAA family ATPase [Gammaproteobacteria bacterium]